jgi:catalase
LHRSGQRYDTGAPSIFFDAAAVIVSEAQARGLAREAAALDFVSDAFNHLKVIGYVPAAEPLLRRAAIIDVRIPTKSPGQSEMISPGVTR